MELKTTSMKLSKKAICELRIYKAVNDCRTLSDAIIHALRKVKVKK